MPTVNYAALSDGFFVTGIVIGGIGLLMLISKTGFFDMISYGLQGLLHLIPGMRIHRQESFYDYKMAREERRGQSNALLALCCGLTRYGTECKSGQISYCAQTQKKVE